ncbi:MAG TPA: PaaI family thioesterase [Pyrinomonadaceae bacterium]|nr:PaaI family thioesterase [Pyrinomonadaceae bacterium]
MKEAELTDAERLRITEAFERVPYAKLIGIEVGQIERGTATLHLNIREELKQNNSIVHGGVIASLLDTAAAFAILTVLEANETTTTIDLTIHYLRPLGAGRASAHARVLRAGRRVIVVSVEVMDEREALAATALTSYLRLT